jgi:hypothetical protein
MSLALAVGFAATSIAAAELRVVATSPRAHAAAAASTHLVWVFDRPVDPATVDGDHFRIFARRSGPPAGTFSIDTGGLAVRFTPASAFFVGDEVVVNLTGVEALDGSMLRAAGYAHELSIAGRPSSGNFEFLSLHSVVGPEPAPRIYGGAIADLDEDGWVDMGIVTQTAADVRVLLNRADGSGIFGPFLTPVNPVGDFPSPNHTADFDHDGNIDLATANKSSATSSILLGRGDGTFDPAVTVPTGVNPSGLAAFDADGDGDWDIATANANSNHLNLALNDGTGAFTPQPPFESGGNREYGLAAVDVDLDGIFDLLVGASTSAQIITLLGNGDGTFRFHASQSSGGGVYKLVPGDVNGDGRLDLSVANGFSGAGSMLIGRGDGTFHPPVTQSSGFHTTATDLGDVDGDGDLDWILSVYGGGFWRVFENDGAGNFAFREDHEANANPACSLILDVDHDGDLDLALLDEITDDVTILENVDVAGDSDGDGVANAQDCAALDSAAWTAPAAARSLRLHRAGAGTGTAILTWTAPAASGSAAPAFDVVRSEDPAAFDGSEPSAICLESGDATDQLAADDELPAGLFAYLVVARNACGTDAGADSSGTPRDVRSCP